MYEFEAKWFLDANWDFNRVSLSNSVRLWLCFFAWFSEHNMPVLY